MLARGIKRSYLDSVCYTNAISQLGIEEEVSAEKIERNRFFIDETFKSCSPSEL